MRQIGFTAFWFCIAAMAAPAMALPGSDSTGTDLGDWQYHCLSAGTSSQCAIVQEVQDKTSNSTVARFAIGPDNDGTLSLLLVFPLNVLLESGAGLVLNEGEPVLLPFRTCEANGCVVRYPISDDLRTAIQSAHEIKLLVAGLDGQVVAIPISMKGYDAAMKSLFPFRN